MKTAVGSFIRLACAGLLVAATTASASAQTTTPMPKGTTARVTQDRATIWKPGFQVAAAVVRAGTVLDVIARRGEWYEVLVPGTEGTSGATGFIFASNIQLAEGPAGAYQPPKTSTTAKRSSPPSSSPSVGVRGFGQVGYTWFSAHDSFNAVLGQSGGAFYGGGGEVRFGRGAFVSGSIEHFSKEGERVVVANDEVFKLGIADTISMTPITVTAGWRFRNDRATPYVGGGVGTVLYKETSEFSDPAENTDSRFTSYHVLGGVEIRNGWVATAFEVQYSRVPDAIGVAGTSAAFNETNLGGIVGRIKILVGR